MRDWPSSAARFIRRLLGSGSEDEAATSSRPVVSSGGLSVLALESMISSAVCRQDPRGGRVSDPPAHEPALNAFGRPVSELHYDSARAVLASTAGLTMTGTRAAAFLSGDRLAEVHDQLFAAAGRRLPLVVHAASRAMPRQSRAYGSGHEGYHAVAATGAFLALARNAQHAVDLTLVARQLAERSLTPGIVAMDGPETASAAQDLYLPSPEQLTAYLGDASALLDCPTAAQRLLFGRQRPAVPRWFDLDRPAAFGTVQAGDDYGVGSAGRKIFFDAAVAALAEQAMREVWALTGRPIGFVFEHALDKAQHVIVAQGSIVELACAVADHLAATEKRRVGVLGVDWLRPFPGAAIAQALEKAEVVTVLERTDDPLGQTPPLLHDVAAALDMAGRSGKRGAGGPKLLSGIYGVGGKTVTAADILAVFDNMAAGSAQPTRFFVGMSPTTVRSAFPKRQVLIDGVHRAYPELDNQMLAPGQPLDLRPPGSRTVSVHCRPATVPEDGLTGLADSLTERIGPHARSRSHVVAHGVWAGTVTVAPEPLRDLGDELPVDVAFVDSLDLPTYVVPVANVVEGGAVVLNLGLWPDQVWDRLPASWRGHVVDHQLSLYTTELSLTEVGESLAALLAGDEPPADAVEPVALGDVGSERPEEPELPMLIRRIARNDTEYDSPGRFWGEVIQPRIMGETPQAVPDPYLAVGAVPASTATFRDASPSRTALPAVLPALCTGCGRCWTACPDSALGPTASSPQALLDTASQAAGTSGPVADKLRRAHRKVAGRLADVLRDSGDEVVTPMLWREAFAWVADKGQFSDDEREEAEAAFSATLGVLSTLPTAVTDTFFGSPEASQKGSGELFTLGVNPQTCQGCTSCVINCPEDAITMVPQTRELIAEGRAGWHTFEALPETTQDTIERVRDELGLAAVLLNRRCHLAVAGGSASEPGSGARLASRLVVGAIEYHSQRAVQALAGSLGTLVDRLRSSIKDGLADAFEGAAPEDLGEALAGVTQQRAPLGDLIAQLEERGQTARVDTDHLREASALTATLEDASWRLLEGQNGIGRARMGLVVTAGDVGDWAARFPHNPFYAPVAVDLGGDGAELAIGVQHGLFERYVDLFRLMRRSQLRLGPKAERAAQAEHVRQLSVRDLAADERAAVPPLVLLAHAEELGTSGLSGLSQILTSDLPITIVLLDRHAQIGAHVDPTLLGLSHRRAFVVSGSIAHPEHLFEGVQRALDYPGPALIHVIAPSPSRDGFPTGSAVDQARLAVQSRVHPLLTYDPGRAGVFGSRLDLTANPSPEATWVIAEVDASADDEAADQVVTPAHWAAQQGRFAGELNSVAEGSSTTPLDEYLALDPEDQADEVPTVLLSSGHELSISERLLAIVEDRLANWTTLQELAGLVTPFTEHVRQRAETDLATQHEAELAQLKQAYEAKLAEARASRRAADVARISQRLMQLAGFGNAPSGPGKTTEGPS